MQLAASKQLCDDTTAEEQRAIERENEMIEISQADIQRYEIDEMLSQDLKAQIGHADAPSAVLKADGSVVAFGSNVGVQHIYSANCLSAALKADGGEVAKVLADASKMFQDPCLSTLVAQARLDASTKVENTISDMVEKLIKGNEDEIEHRYFCGEELNNDERDTDMKQRDNADLEAKIGDLAMTTDTLAREIGALKADVAIYVHFSRDEMDVDAGDRRIMFAYASDEKEVAKLLTILIATRLGKKLTDIRKDGSLWWLRPDGKSQVTIEGKQNANGSMEPLKVHTVVISTQHAEPSKAVRSKECEGHAVSGTTTPTVEMTNRQIWNDEIAKVFEEIFELTGVPAGIKLEIEQELQLVDVQHIYATRGHPAALKSGGTADAEVAGDRAAHLLHRSRLAALNADGSVVADVDKKLMW